MKRTSFWRQWNIGVLLALVFYPSMGGFAILLRTGIVGEDDKAFSALLALAMLLVPLGVVLALAFTVFRLSVWVEPERMGRPSASVVAHLGGVLAWAAFLCWGWAVLPLEGMALRLGLMVVAVVALLLSARRRPGVPPPGFLKRPLGLALALGGALLTVFAALVLTDLLTLGQLIPGDSETQALVGALCFWAGVAGGCAALSWLLARGQVGHLERLRPALRFLGAACAFLLPGTPQIARGKALHRHALVCLLGCASLANLAIAGLNLSNHIATLDILESIASPNLGAIFPSTLSTDEGTAGDLTLVAEVSPQKVTLEWLRPIQPKTGLLVPGLHFWESVFAYLLLYALCAVWSLRDHLRARALREAVAPASGRARP